MATAIATKTAAPRRRSKTAAIEFAWALREARVPERRRYRDWVREEVVIVDGPREGDAYDVDFAPWTGLWFDELDSGRWRRHVAVGPVQSGKTLTCFVIPICYHLFEVGEKVIGGIPTEEIARDKWEEDIKPTILETRSYKGQVPTAGRGSEGGFSISIRFMNRRALRFMTGGGKNSKRSAYTSRVVVITEVDQFQQSTMGSDETDKIRQLEARTQAYGDRAMIFMECTVTTTRGRIWQEYINGSRSRIMKKCPHCGAWVNPERQHLVGWQSAKDEMEAKENGYFICPACEHRLTDGKGHVGGDRLAMLRSSKLVHHGQEILEDGTIIGDPPRTETLGFRWNAFDNPLVSTQYIAAEEWKNQQDGTDESEKRMKQLVWAWPTDEDDESVNTVDLKSQQITSRQRSLAQGKLPDNTVAITCGIDVGLHLCHWVAIAWMPGAIGHIIDYQSIGVPSGSSMTIDQAIEATVMEITEELAKGWVKEDGEIIHPTVQLVDSHWKTEVIYRATRGKHRNKSRIFPYMGFGGNRGDYMTVQQRPKNLSNVVFVGERYQGSVIRGAGVVLVEGDADFWKMRVHEAFFGPIDQTGSLTLYNRPAFEHNDFARNILAESPEEIQRPGGGSKIRFVTKSRQNHKLDCSYMALIAGHMIGMKWSAKQTNPQRAPTGHDASREPRIQTPDGRPFSILARSE